uniref:Barrier-to-autointegration factor n=1 Tax=Sus scrofa TaxID=9823 RepID=A0A8D1UL61_PIG
MRISQKHRDFVAEPMGEKPMGSLVGIGEVMGKKLEERGFDKACIVLGQFLVFKMKTSSGNAFLSEFLTPSLTYTFTPDLFYAIPPSFFFFRIITVLVKFLKTIK